MLDQALSVSIEERRRIDPMLKWLVLVGVLVGVGFVAYKRLLAPVDDTWDDDTMYGSEQIHEVADAAANPTV
jgi:hypothetical protein